MGFFSAADLFGIPFSLCGFGKVSWVARFEFSAFLHAGDAGFKSALFRENIFTSLVGAVVFGGIAVCGDFVGSGHPGGRKEPWAPTVSGLALCLVSIWADVNWRSHHSGGHWDPFGVGGGGSSLGGGSASRDDRALSFFAPARTRT